MNANPTIPAAMLVVVAATPGGPEALQVVERPVPKPACGEVLMSCTTGCGGIAAAGRHGRYVERNQVVALLMAGGGQGVL